MGSELVPQLLEGVSGVQLADGPSRWMKSHHVPSEETLLGTRLHRFPSKSGGRGL